MRVWTKHVSMPGTDVNYVSRRVKAAHLLYPLTDATTLVPLGTGISVIILPDLVTMGL